MVSGFFTSPWLHWRMSSAVARPIRSSSKKLTSSTWFLLSFNLCENSRESSQRWWGFGMRVPQARAYRPLSFCSSDLFDRARLAPGQVDAELLRRAEGVLVRFLHLDGLAIGGEDLDVETQRLHLLEEDLEGLGDAGVGDVLALDDRLVDLHAARDVVGLDGEQLLQRVGRAVGLEGPDLHLTEALATELGLTAERLLGDHRVGAGRPCVDLVVDEVVELEDVHVAHRHGLRERLAGAAVEEQRLAGPVDEPHTVSCPVGRVDEPGDDVLAGAVEDGACDSGARRRLVGVLRDRLRPVGLS